MSTSHRASGRPAVRRRLTVATVVIAALAVAACGSDGDSTSATETAARSSVVSTDGSTTDDSGPPIAPLTGEQICERLTIDSVAADTGLDVTTATPDDSSTPQCAYGYTSSSGGTSNLTVASMRPEDVGGLSGTAAFDFVVMVNKSIAGDAGVEEQEVSAGDAAIRLSGGAMHLGVLQVGDRILTLIVPADDVQTDAVDHLISTMATALG